jgi:hypothetical protein
MLHWLKSIFKGPELAGPPRRIRLFSTADRTLSQDVLVVDQEGWRAEFSESRTFSLFELPVPGPDHGILTFRAKLKTEDLHGRAYLEMWCRFQAWGEFFSKGYHHAIRGTNDWISLETPFYLKKDQRPDLVKLNLAAEGGGKVWIKEVELLYTPLK